MSVQAALQQGADLLNAATISAARLTAEVLLCHAMHCERAYLYAHSSEPLTQLAWIHYGRFLNERLQGKPTQYITHRQEFYGRDFYVDEDVLIPRPETEHLVEATLRYVREFAPRCLLDVGTGSGAIAISVALECNREIFASDISLAALKVAERNRGVHDARVRFMQADLLMAVADRSVDLVVSNPPYVPGADAANMQTEVRDWEPHVALFACNDGFEIYRRLIDQAEQALRTNGRLIMELGYRSLANVQEMMAERWRDIEVVSDLAGWPRVIGARLTSP